LLLISEVLESNGSTSMASVCGSTLALMDAGIKIKAPVAGIAMGLMSDGKEFKVLTDIIGMEDFCGDMDFKVAGTREGITALQLDTKLDGIPDDVLARALNQALDARLQILDVMEAEIAAPRETVADSAPQVQTMQINPEKIGALIGPGGATIKKITAESGASLDVQQDGRVLIGSSNAEQSAKAMQMVREAVGDIEMGQEFVGVVTRIMGRGVLVELPNGKQGFVPKEHITLKEIDRIEEVVNMGDSLNVKTFELDAMGRLNLTAIGVKQSLETLEGNEHGTPPASTGGGDAPRGVGRGGDRGRGGPRRDGGDRGPRRDGGDRGDRGPRRDDRGGDSANFRKRQ
jgi:polyribonucleotide nucleotidyltransferase